VVRAGLFCSWWGTSGIDPWARARELMSRAKRTRRRSSHVSMTLQTAERGNGQGENIMSTDSIIGLQLFRQLNATQGSFVLTRHGTPRHMFFALQGDEPGGAGRDWT
jgi:hypothetical protein